MKLRLICIVFMSLSVVKAIAGDELCIGMNELGAYATGEFVRSVEVVGEYAYMTCSSEGGLAILDVSDPELPVLIGSFATQFPALQVVMDNEIAYVRTTDPDRNWSNYLNIIDVGDPTTPTLMDRIAIKGPVLDMDFLGSIAYFAGADFGLLILDLDSRIMVGTYQPTHQFGGYMTDVRVADGIAYVGYFSLPMELIDVGVPSNPFRLGSTNIILIDPVIVGNTLYAIEPYCFKVYAVDVSDSTTPAVLEAFETLGGVPYAIAVRDETVFVSYEHNAWTDAFDFTDPENPELLGVYEGSGFVGAIDGDLLFLSDLDGELKIVDATDSCSFVCIADFTGDLVLDFHDIAVFLTFFNAGGLEADLTNDGGLDFFDISAFLSAFAAGCP